MKERKLTYIGCPMGCQLQIIIKDGIVEKVTGNTCKRGADYGKKEVTDPTRIVTSTVRVQGGTLPVVSVKTRDSNSAGTGAYWRCNPEKCSGNRNRYNSYPKYRENFVKIEDCVLAESYVK